MINDKTRWHISVMAIMRFIIRKLAQKAIKPEKDMIDIVIDRKSVDIPNKEYICWWTFQVRQKYSRNIQRIARRSIYTRLTSCIILVIYYHWRNSFEKTSEDLKNHGKYQTLNFSSLIIYRY